LKGKKKVVEDRGRLGGGWGYVMEGEEVCENGGLEDDQEVR